mgnify:FL=1
MSTRAEQLKELSNNWVKSMKEYNMSLATALINLKSVIMADYAKFLKEIDGSVDKFGVEFEYGSKYVKIVTISGGGSRSVHCFVEKENGNIWRAASWKAPARNFVRGNVFDQASYINRIQWTGVS